VDKEVFIFSWRDVPTRSGHLKVKFISFQEIRTEKQVTISSEAKLDILE